MNDDNSRTLPQDDNQTDPETRRLHSRYDRSLRDTNPNIDDMSQDDFLPESAELDDGLSPDARDDVDVDEETLPSDDDNSITESGLNEVDMPTEGKSSLGDIIMREEDFEDSDGFTIDEEVDEPDNDDIEE